MNIGDLFMALKIDPSGDLKAAVTKSAEDAGNAGGVTLGKAISTALKGASLLIGAGLAVATKGAVEAEAAQGKFMKATGASREEAKAFVTQMDALAGSAGTANHSFEEIAATGTMVEQQFGTTGDKTRELTEATLEYSNVVGGEADQNAAQLEDTLSSLNLTADDAVGLMDKLVASSQKYGTDAGPAALAALQDMAPALGAMGMGLDDGIAFLNAFEVAGGHAEDATAALNKAVKTLKPGQDIDDLIKQVSSIEDPLLRSQKATELFGKAAGPGMFKLIKPGMQSLDDYKISAEEAAGTTSKAANDMLTFTDRIKGWADKALAGARELGQQFGPALSGVGAIAGAIGPTLISAVQKAWGMVKDSPAAQKAVEGAFDIAGTAVGAAGTIVGNLSADLIKVFTTGWDDVKGWLLKPGSVTARIITGTVPSILATQIPLAAAGTTVGTAVGGAISAGMITGMIAGVAFAVFLPQILDKLTGQDAGSKMANIGRFWADATLTGYSDEAKAGAGQAFQAAWDAARASGAGADAAAQAGKAAADKYLGVVTSVVGPGLAVSGNSAGMQMAAATVGGFTAASGAWAHMGDFLTPTLQAAAQQAGNAGGEAVVPAWIQAQDAAANANKNSLTLWDIVLQEHRARQAEADEVFRNSARALTGDLAGELQKGAKSVVKDAMDKLLWAMNHPMALNRRTAEIEAALNGQALADGLASKNPAIRTVAEQTRFTLIAEWEKINGKPYGQSAGADFKTALGDQLRAAVAAARAAVNDINAYLRSIKSKVVVTFDSRGELVGHGGNPGIPGRASGGSALAGHLYRVNESRMEYFRPDVSGQVIPLGDHAPAALTFAPNIVVHGASDPQATADAIDQRMRRAWSDFVGQARSAASIRPAESF